MTPLHDLVSYTRNLGRRARAAASLLATLIGDRKNAWLLASASALEKRADEILAANARDLSAAKESDLGPAQLDRLRLTPERLKAAADGLREVAALPDPIGRVL